MRAVKAVPSAVNGTWGIDTVLPITRETAIMLLGKNVTVVTRYIDSLTPEEIAGFLSVGMQFDVVGYAMELDPSHTLARLRALGIPAGVTVWQDIEGKGLDVADVMRRSNACALAVRGEGWDPGAYVGAGCPLTAEQLSGLVVDRYWHSVSRALEPSRGYCKRQVRPDDVFVGGLKVDRNVIEPDYQGDLPMLASA